MRRSRPQNAYRVSLSAMLISLMLVLGYIESLIPTGVPGIRIGLSNGVLIFSVYMLGIPSAYILMALKVYSVLPRNSGNSSTTRTSNGMFPMKNLQKRNTRFCIKPSRRLRTTTRSSPLTQLSAPL